MRAPLVSLLVQSLSLPSFTYALQLYWPNQVFQNQAALVKWDGEALYHFQVQQINANGTFTILNDGSGLNVTELQWFASIPAGQTIFFFLSDSTGSSVQSDNVVIQAPNVTNTQTSSQSSSSTTSPAVASSSPYSTSTTGTEGSTPTPLSSTMPTQGNGGMSKGTSIPYIVGVLGGVLAIIASVFLWRFLRAYLRRRSVAKLNATSGNTWWSPKEGPRSDMAQASSTPSPFMGSSSALLLRGVGATPRDLPPKNTLVEDSLVHRTENPSFPCRARDSIPIDLDISIASSCYPIPSVPVTAFSHDLPREPENVAIVDNARASSIMLPFTAASDRTPGTHSISGSASHQTTGTTRSSNDLTTDSRGRPGHNFQSSNGLILPHELRTSRLSSPNPFDDTVFAVPLITESTPRSHSERGAGSSTSFPQDPSEDEISILSVSTSHLAHSCTPVSNLPTIDTTLKRTLTRAARDYPRTPTTPYSPASTTHTGASLPLPNTTHTSPGRSISILPYVNLGRSLRRGRTADLNSPNKGVIFD